MRDPVYDDMKSMSREKYNHDRALFLEQAKKVDDGGWQKNSEWHWQRPLAGFTLDYWPSRKKYMYRGRVARGDVYQFMRSVEKREAGE